MIKMVSFSKHPKVDPVFFREKWKFSFKNMGEFICVNNGFILKWAYVAKKMKELHL